MAETAMMQPNEKTQSFLGQVMGSVAGAMMMRLCAMGDELGLFKELAKNGSATNEQLAARTGLNERYLREWIYGIAATGALDFDKTSRKDSICDEYVPLLADEAGPLFQGALFRQMTGLLKPYPQIFEAFRNGGGVDYSEYDADWWDGLERSTCVRYRNFLVSQMAAGNARCGGETGPGRPLCRFRLWRGRLHHRTGQGLSRCDVFRV